MSTPDVVVDKVEDKAPVAAPSYLEMSDEDIMNMAPPDAAPVVDSVDTPDVVAAEDKAEDAADAATDAATDADADAAPTPTTDPDADDANEGGDSQPEAGGDAAKDDKTKEPAAEKPAADDKPKTEAPAIDFKAEYERLLAPFKANGREIKVDSVDDALALMQMGANYNKKMAGLKPNLKLLKMLENNGLLSEEKIGFLIDLGKKDPAAINKLVKDSGIDPMDLDAEKAKAYKQTAYAVGDNEIDLDTVLDDLQGTPTYARTLDVVSNKWDVASKQTISSSPQLLRVINDHIASGIYDLISTEVEKEKMLGRLNGLSDIESYRQVGDAIQARGGFNHLGKPKVENTPPAAPVVVQPKPKKADDPKLNDKRRAASSTQPVAPASTPLKDFNPLSMSDEEFSRMATPKFS